MQPAATLTPEVRRTRALALKEEGNALAKGGDKAEALKKYEKGIRQLGLLEYELDEDGTKAMAALDDEGRELLSVLASNAAQMYMNPSTKQLGTALERCTLAIQANPKNAKAYFRRASAANDHAEHVAKGADAMLARAQEDVRKFLELDATSAAGKQLRDHLDRKRSKLQGPLLRERRRSKPETTPEWYQEIRNHAIFVCMCGTTAEGRDQLFLPEALLSMATHAKGKRAISVGVAYVGYKAREELEMFDETWQRKYYRMLNLGERAVMVPSPRQVDICGETYNVWSLLEGRVRVMRVDEFRANGSRVGVGWMRYCAQLLWHGEPFVYQSCSAYLRFVPQWDERLLNDLALAARRSPHRPVLSWMSRSQEEEAWQWVSQAVDIDGNCSLPTGVLAAERLDASSGWATFRKRYFSHTFGVPPMVAFCTPHNMFSASDLLMEVPADPCLDELGYNRQIMCENVRLHTHGWDTLSPCVNCTWDCSRDARKVSRRLAGVEPDQNTQANEDADQVSDPKITHKVRADACIYVPEAAATPLDQEMLTLPVPTPLFWTTLLRDESCPWQTGQEVGFRFLKGTARGMPSFEQRTGVELSKGVITERAQNAGFNSDRDFEDSASSMARREAAMGPRWGRMPSSYPPQAQEFYPDAEM